MDDGRTWAQLRERIHHAVCDLVQELGGSISAEHGIGRLKAAELAARKSPLELELMRRLKEALDPAGILNPGGDPGRAGRRRHDRLHARRSTRSRFVLRHVAGLERGRGACPGWRRRRRTWSTPLLAEAGALGRAACWRR